MEVLISVAEQKMVVLRDGGLLRKYPISTSRFGVGDAYGSYKTPLGQLRVCDKVGDDLMPGAVIKHRAATGEVLDVNAPGRDPIVTRILWLDGLEEQNRNAKARGIYIHGTPEEKKLGEPVSWGCIRMRSKDVVELFDEIPLGASVRIIAERLPRLRKYEPPKPVIIAARPAPTPAPRIAAVAPTPAPVRIAAAKTTLPKTTPMPAPIPAYDPLGLQAAKSQAKTAPQIAAAAPAKRGSKALPEVADGPRSTDAVPSSFGDGGAFAAMKGSILFAGLPDGPAPQSISTSEPGKLVHSAPLSVPAPADGLSLNPVPSPAEALPASAGSPTDLAVRNPLPIPGGVKPADRQ
jgi:hypothetical protein